MGQNIVSQLTTLLMLVGAHFRKKNLLSHISHFKKIGNCFMFGFFFSQKTKTFNGWYFIIGVDHFF
jgi:hypothetical protein